MKRVLAAALFCIVVCFASFRAEAAARTIRVGFYRIDGFQEMNEAGEKSGYGYEYLQNLRRYADWKYEYVGYDKKFTEIQEMLQKGEIDMVAAIIKNKEREKLFDFSKYQITTSAAAIYVMPDRAARLKADGGASYNGMRIGLMKGTSQVKSLEKFAKEQGFVYSPVFYGNNSELVEALYKGKEIDAVVTSNMRKIDGAYTLAQFDARPTHIAVRKGDAGLLKEIDYAMTQLRRIKPGIEDELFYKYYGADRDGRLAFSPEERDFIKRCKDENKFFLASLNADHSPYSFFKDGKATGIFGDIMQEVIRRSGLDIRIVESKGHGGYFALTEDKATSICLDERFDYNNSEATGYRLTDPYYSTTISKLVRKDHVGQGGRAAVIKGSYIDLFDIKRHRGDSFIFDNLVYCSSIKECAEAVLSKKCDEAYLYTRSAQEAVYLDETNSLTSIVLPAIPAEFAIGVRDTESHLLVSILNKAAGSVKLREISEIARRYTDFPAVSLTLTGYLYNNPLSVVAALLFLCGTLMLAVMYHMSQKRRAVEAERSFEFERFIGYVCTSNDDVSEVDLAANTKTHYMMENGKVKRFTEPFDPGNAWNKFIHPEDLDRLKMAWSKESIYEIIKEQKNVYSEFRMLQPDGSYQWGACLLKGIAVDAKHPCSYMTFYRNINEAKVREEQQKQLLTESLAAARQASMAKGTFLRRMSHEIRTPLNAIIGFNAIADDLLNGGTEPLAGERRRELASITEKTGAASRHLLSLINDILDVSAIESGRIQLTRENFDLNELLSSVEAMFREQAETKGLRFLMSREDIPCALKGDRLRLNQVLMNLLSNAVKFTDRGGEVLFNISRRTIKNGAVFVRFEVRDDGIGMKEDFRSHIFEPFWQGDASISAKYGGTGLGMPITKSLVDLMGGELTISSELGLGSDFIVDIPFEAAEKQPEEIQPEKAAGKKSHRESYDFGGKRVLVAEDHPTNMEITTRLLRIVNFTVEQAVNGKEAAEKFMAAPKGYYSLILMDVQMPEMDGYQATTVIRQSDHPDGKTVPILAMTAHAFTDDIAKSMASGMNAHLSKPIIPAEFYMTLSMFVKSE